MANFFKDFQNELKQKKLVEIRKEEKKQAIQNYVDNLKVGQKISYSFLIDTTTNKPIIYTGYFLRDADDCVWVSKTKQDVKDGYGSTISKSCIIIK